MSNNTFKLAPYDKFFGIIYKSFQNKGKELTPEMQKTVEIYDRNYAAADERVAPAPAPLAEAADERVELAPVPLVPLAPLAAKGQVKLQRFVQQKQQQQEQVKDLQSKLDSLQARHEQTEAALSRCHETLAASAAITTAKSAVANPIQQDEINALLGNSPRARGSSPPNSPMSSSGLRQRRRASQGGKRKTKFKKNIKVYNKTSKKYKNIKAGY